MTLLETIASEYVKIVTDEDVDFKRFDEIIKSYVSNPDNNSVSETFEVGNYNIKVYMGEVDYLKVLIKSNCEVK